MRACMPLVLSLANEPKPIRAADVGLLTVPVLLDLPRVRARSRVGRDPRQAD